MLRFVLDLFFPKRCAGCKKLGSFVCSNCFSSISFDTRKICPVCNRNSIDGRTHVGCKSRYSLDGLTTGVVYNRIIRRLLYQFKYNPYVSGLSEIISSLFYEAVIQDEVLYSVAIKNPIVIPVPLSKIRARKRGYNHAAILGKEMAKRLLLEFLDDILIRIRDTKPQFQLKRKERLDNIKGSFDLNAQKKADIVGKEILVIDDLATTCATMNEAARVLKRNGAKSVWGLAFAREN